MYNGYNNGNNNNYAKINNGNAKTTEETQKNEEQVKLKNHPRGKTHKEQEQKKNEQEKNNSEQNAEINTQSIKRNSDIIEIRLEGRKGNNSRPTHTPSNNKHADHRNAKKHLTNGNVY